MTEIRLDDPFAAPEQPIDPDHCSLNHTAYLLDVDANRITLTCAICHLPVNSDWIEDAISTGCEIPVTAEWISDPGDGWEHGPELTGTLTPRDAPARITISDESIQLLRNTLGVWEDNANGIGCALPHKPEWYRARIADFEQLLTLVKPADRHRPLTDEPCGVIPTPRGQRLVAEYRAHRTKQHPKVV